MELTNLADPEIGTMLTGRGYRLVAFENVLGKSLDASATPRVFDGIDIRMSAENELDDWLEVVVAGFARPDEQGVAVVTTAPGSKSQQNVQRQGFQLLYTRAVLVK